MAVHSGMRGMINAPDEKPKITRQLLRRVLTYAKPYRWMIVGMLILILANTGLMLLTPLVLRDLIDHTIPSGNIGRLMMLAAALLLI
ncbi:MAG TPA: ABC transporter ATP-binding protein, partial [Clostridia bacterium]|nr:ABC transporter ATP-binding protein [Clostridia bacterium]